MFQSSVVCIGLIIQLISVTNTQDIDRLIKFHSDNGLGHQQPMLSSLGQRPTQFAASQQQGPTIHHSNGGLVRPANNQNELDNFHSFNQAPKYPILSSNASQSNVAVVNHEDSRVLRDRPRHYQQHQQHQTDDEANNNSNSNEQFRSQNPRKLNVNLWPDQQRDLSPVTQMRNFLHGNIELALRQTSTDENVFRPSPAISIPDSRDLEPWSLHSSSSARLPTAPGQAEIETPNANRKQPDISQQQESTTEQSNVIATAAASAPSSPGILTPPNTQVDYQPAEISIPNNGQYQNEYPSSLGGGGGQSPQVTIPETVGHNEQQQEQQQNYTTTTAAAAAAAELHNHVVYEGPATAPPTGDYYFSSSERFPNNGKASNVWWSLGIGLEYEKASNLTRDNYLDYCSNSVLLMTNKQRSLCRSHPRMMPIVARGLKMAIDECQFRFTSSRWNCSLVLQDALDEADHHLAAASYHHGYNSSSSAKSPPQPFGEVMKHPNRERSFLNAIVAAGLAHAMTKACSNGELPEECSCDKKIKSKNNRGKIEWVACSDDIDFGARFSRDFIDNTDNDSDTTNMINTHNYEVGRRIFKSAIDITCTCQNSENGLCQAKRCWKHLGPFTDIGDELMRRYEGATHVQLSSKDPHKLRPVRRGVRRPKRKDLVYIDESPDYCTPNTRLGVLGTQNRRCNSTSSGPDSCSLLCCGRGYQVVVEEIEEDCNCKFVWCCQVKCDKCRRHITNDICN